MSRYDYKEAVYEDIKNWATDYAEANETSIEEMGYDFIYDNGWNDDSVTGNASGSYTFSRWTARDYFFEDGDTDDYVQSMIEEGFVSASDIGKWVAESDWERIDVCIRCYLLGEAVQRLVDENC